MKKSMKALFLLLFCLSAFAGGPEEDQAKTAAEKRFLENYRAALPGYTGSQTPENQLVLGTYRLIWASSGIYSLHKDILNLIVMMMSLTDASHLCMTNKFLLSKNKTLLDRAKEKYYLEIRNLGRHTAERIAVFSSLRPIYRRRVITLSGDQFFQNFSTVGSLLKEFRKYIASIKVYKLAPSGQYAVQVIFTDGCQGAFILSQIESTMFPEDSEQPSNIQDLERFIELTQSCLVTEGYYSPRAIREPPSADFGDAETFLKAWDSPFQLKAVEAPERTVKSYLEATVSE